MSNPIATKGPLSVISVGRSMPLAAASRPINAVTQVSSLMCVASAAKATRTPKASGEKDGGKGRKGGRV